jgi:hypothetical protein
LNGSLRGHSLQPCSVAANTTCYRLLHTCTGFDSLQACSVAAATGTNKGLKQNMQQACWAPHPPLFERQPQGPQSAGMQQQGMF